MKRFLDDIQVDGKRVQTVAIPGILLLILIAAYSVIFTRPAEFVGDDSYYIFSYPSVQTLNSGSLRAIWTQPMKNDYYPVTITSYAVDYALWGPDARKFRITNFFIFCCIGLTVYLLAVHFNKHYSGLNQLAWIAMLSTLVVLLHPANVEAVSAVSNRKELLYVLFGILSFLCYIQVPRTVPLLFLAGLFLILAQLSKGTAVVIPLLLFAYEFLYREKRQAGRTFVYPAILLLLSLLLMAYQLTIAVNAGVVGNADTLSVGQRIAGVVRTLHSAMCSAFVPHDLNYDYMIEWPRSLTLNYEWIAPILAVGIMVFSFVNGYRQALFFMLFITIPFLPYANVLPLKHGVRGLIVYYDHYLLFSLCAGAPLITWLLITVKNGWKQVMTAAFFLLCLIFFFQSQSASQFWISRANLYKHIIAVNPESTRAYLFLGRAYISSGQYESAQLWLRRGLQTKKGAEDSNLYEALGDASAFSGKYQEAEYYYRIKIAVDPQNVKVLQNLSSTLIMLQKYEDARQVIKKWLLLQPGNPSALTNLGLLPPEKKTGGGR